MCFVIEHTDYGFCIQPCRLCLLVRQPCPAAIERGQQTHHSRSQTAAIAAALTMHLLCHCAGCEIGGRPHRGPLRLICQCILNHCAVPDCIDIREVCPQFLVHQNRAFIHLNSRIIQKCRCRSDANRQNHHVRLQGPRVGTDTLHTVPSMDSLEAHRGQHTHSSRLELALGISSHIRVKRIGHDLRRGVDHGHVHLHRSEVLRHLKPDKTCSAHHCTAAVVRLCVCANRHGIIRCAHAEGASKPHTFHWRHKRRGTRRYNQLVIIFCKTAPVGTADGYLLRTAVYADCLAPCLHFGPRKSRILFRRIDNQLVSGGNVAANIVWQPTARVGNICTFRIDDNLCLPVEAFELRRGFRTRRHAA